MSIPTDPAADATREAAEQKRDAEQTKIVVPPGHRVVYYPDIPREFLPPVRECVERAAFIDGQPFLLPGWCERLYVATGTGGGNAAADTRVRVPYRWTRLTVYPAWFDQSDYVRQANIVHELMHVFVNPLYLHALDSLTDTLRAGGIDKGGLADKLLARSVPDTLEGCVEDLTHALMRSHPAFRDLRRDNASGSYTPPPEPEATDPDAGLQQMGG